MVRSRRAAREAAFQAVYQCVCGGCPIDEAVAEALVRQSFTAEASGFVSSLAAGAMTSVVELDSRFAPFLKIGWTPERLAMVDRLLLRMAVYELWSCEEVPPKVTITEYVKLAKRFGSADSDWSDSESMSRLLSSGSSRSFARASSTRPSPSVDMNCSGSCSK